MTAEQLVDLVLSSAHPRLQERCSRDQIVNLLQEKHAAYDAHGVHSLLARKYDAVEEQLEAANAAPSTFVSSLWLMVQPALSTAAEEDEPLPPQEPPNSGSSCEPPPKPSVGKQVSLGSFFGKGSVTHYSKLPDGTRVIDRVDQMTDEQLKALPDATVGGCPKCGRTFSHAPAMASHVKVCKGTSATAAAVAVAATAFVEDVATSTAPTFSVDAAADAGWAAFRVATEADDVQRPPGKVPKLRKDGVTPKQSGQREGWTRTPRTLYFKLEIVKTFRRFERLKSLGLCPFPNQATVEVFPNILPSDVTKYVKKEVELRHKLMHEHRVTRKHKNRFGAMATFSSSGARRASLHPGREPAFAAAREQLHHMYREKRARGERVTGPWLRVSMKRLVRKYYGGDVADSFKADKGWLRNYARYYGIALRRKSNTKSEPIEMRLPKIKRWHARLRRRLKRGQCVDPVYGRWLPHNRLSHDQVGANLRAGLQNTYDEKGAKRVWIAGGKADDGKRFCTFNITTRAVGIEGKPRRGQPKMSVT